MQASELKTFFLDSLKSSLQKQFLIANRIEQLGKMPQPGVYIEAIEVSGSSALEGKMVGSFKGVLVTAQQNTSAGDDPFLRYFFYVPIDPATIQSQKSQSAFSAKQTGIKVTIVTDIAEKYITNGQDEFRNTHKVTRDVVGILSGESSSSFGTKSFNELYKEADAKFSTLYGGSPDQQTVTVGGMMKMLLEVTGQMHLAESGVTGTGTFLNGDYGLYTTGLFSAVEAAKDSFDRNLNISAEGRKEAFIEYSQTLELNSFTSGARFDNAFDDFKKYNLCEYVLAGRDTSASLFFNPEIENSIYQITEAGAPDPREGFVENIVQQDQLGAVEKLVASSLLGAKVNEDQLKIDQIKRITNILASTQAAKQSVSKSASGLGALVDTEMRKYLNVYKRILSRAGSVIA